jgi:hypothetical protein
VRQAISKRCSCCKTDTANAADIGGVRWVVMVMLDLWFADFCLDRPVLSVRARLGRLPECGCWPGSLYDGPAQEALCQPSPLASDVQHLAGRQATRSDHASPQGRPWRSSPDHRRACANLERTLVIFEAADGHHSTGWAAPSTAWAWCSTPRTTSLEPAATSSAPMQYSSTPSVVSTAAHKGVAHRLQSP